MEATTVNAFAKPVPVSDLEIAFSGNTDKLLPRMDEIPEEFKHDSNKWVRVVHDWFFSGLKNDEWIAKPGIEFKLAIRHVKACLQSFTPQHEHKTAGCAYLLSLWFDDVKYEKAK